MKIISGSSSNILADTIARQLDIPLSSVEIFVFPDGERRVRIEEEIIDQDVVIVQSTATPVDQNYMELFFLLDSAKRSGAKNLTVVMPYLGYQRQDHVFRDGEAVSIQVIIKLLESLSVDRVIAYDLHTIRIPELFSIPVTHLSALSLFAQKIRDNHWMADTVLVTPDMGGIRRIEILSGLLDSMPWVSIEKNRDLATGSIESHLLHGEIKRRAIIVDDMISSGNTIVKAAELLQENGAQEIYVFATHPVFSQSAPQLLQDSIVDKVFVTDTVDVPLNKRFPKLHMLSVGEEIAKEIKN